MVPKLKFMTKGLNGQCFKILITLILIILWFEYQFKEVSVLYSFHNVRKTVFDIKKDYDELVREGSY